MRKSGILLHISSLPSRYGIGSLGQAAYEFIDALHAAQQRCWQILPTGPLSRFRSANNPYQGLSAFANNYYFIDLDMLVEDGMLNESDLVGLEFCTNEARVDYAAQFECKLPLFKKAYENGIEKYREAFFEYQAKNAYWLIDYSMFMALLRIYDYKNFNEWPEPYARRRPTAMRDFEREHAEEIEFEQFVQFLYERQWRLLKKYANDKGIEIIGDMPFYVSPGSAEEWVHPEMFRHDGYEAGVPPDQFSEDGQKWENSLYDWDYLESKDYNWWILRMERAMELFDVIRVDHFRGFESYYAIPKGAHPREGRWMMGPGIMLFKTMEKELGKLPVIAEDLGFITPEVVRMLRQSGFMGTRVLQFGFDERDSLYLPHHYPQHCVVYTGTHDNNTIKGWYAMLPEKSRKLVEDYIGVYAGENVTDAIIRLAMGSVAKLCILPMQDVLGLGEECRMNYPTMPQGNWKWRMLPDAFSQPRIQSLLGWTKTYGRGSDAR